MIKFIDQYLEQINSLLHLIHACRSADWEGFLAALLNYAGMIPVYSRQMTSSDKSIDHGCVTRTEENKKYEDLCRLNWYMHPTNRNTGALTTILAEILLDSFASFNIVVVYGITKRVMTLKLNIAMKRPTP